MKEAFFKKCTEESKRRKSTEKRRKMAIRRKAVIVAVLILLMSFGTNVQAYAAGDAYAYELVDRVKSKSVKKKDDITYSSIEGLALGDKDGKAYVLKTNGKSGTQCLFFAGKRKNLVEKNNQMGNLGHGNDMTYRRNDGKLYVATMKKSIVRMTTNGDVEKTINMSYPVSGIACWFNYNKKNNQDAFILKSGNVFHIVTIDGTKVTEICSFQIHIDNGKKLNQGICMYQGILYVTYWDNSSGNSYVYRVKKSMSTVAKEKGKKGEIRDEVTETINGKKVKKTIWTYDKTQIVTLDKKKLLAAAGVDSGKPLKIEIESIAFTGGYLYFTANANYEDKNKKSYSLDGLYKVSRQLVV